MRGHKEETRSRGQGPITAALSQPCPASPPRLPPCWPPWAPGSSWTQGSTVVGPTSRAPQRSQPSWPQRADGTKHHCSDRIVPFGATGILNAAEEGAGLGTTVQGAVLWSASARQARDNQIYNRHALQGQMETWVMRHPGESSARHVRAPGRSNRTVGSPIHGHGRAPLWSICTALRGSGWTRDGRGLWRRRGGS